MSLILSFCAFVLFTARSLLIKTPTDILFMLVSAVIVFLDMFQQDSRVCRFFYAAGCIGMCAVCLVMTCLNTFFDSSFMISCAIWLVLLFFPILDNKSCFNRGKTV